MNLKQDPKIATNYSNMTQVVGIDLIVPIYKNAKMTVECVESILQNIDEISAYKPRVVLVNDSPDDLETSTALQDIKRRNKDVQILVNEHNLGFVKSVNRALEIACADGRDAILINSDTVTFPNTLMQILAVAALDEQIAFVCPRSNNASLCTMPHLPHAQGGIIPTPQAAYLRWQHLAKLLPRMHFSPTAVGFYLFIKHEVLANFGGLREEFGLGYEEENDLVMRASKVGYRAAIANHAFAFHHGSASFNLTDLSLEGHRNSNLSKISKIHPEFIPLVQRYEHSTHFRAEKLISALIPDQDGRISVLIDLSTLGPSHNGTNQQAVAIIKAISANHRHQLALTILCNVNAFKFHELDLLPGARQIDAIDGETFAIGIRLGQPFDLHHINVLEGAAPIVVYGMFDTIALDCSHLAVTNRLDDLWGYVARHANGIFYISKFGQRTFENRFPAAVNASAYGGLFPTALASYSTSQEFGSEHILVLGNHFPHKASDYTAEEIAKKYASLQIVVLGAKTYRRGNIRSFQSGEIAQRTVDDLYAKASIIVLPSFAEGFGFGLMHALAAGKPIVARNIAPTREIFATFEDVKGVFLYSTQQQLFKCIDQAAEARKSSVDSKQNLNWNTWTAGFVEMLLSLSNRSDTFFRLTERLREGDALRARAALGWLVHSGVAHDLTSVRKQYLPFIGQSLLAVPSKEDSATTSSPTEDNTNDDLEKVARRDVTVESLTTSADGRQSKVLLSKSQQKDESLESLPENSVSQIQSLLAVPSKEDSATTSSPADDNTNNDLEKSQQKDEYLESLPENSASQIHVDQLLGGDPQSFLTKAYLIILRRAPDETGLKNYLKALDQGTSRETVLLSIRNSPEGNKVGLNLIRSRHTVDAQKKGLIKRLLGK